MRPLRHLAAIALACLAAPRAGGAQQPAAAPVSPRAIDTTEARAPGITTRVAGDSALEAKVRSVAQQLRCPVCQGLSLQDSPSELSQEMRDLVREQLRAGKSPDEVKQYFVSRYGEWILLDPEAHGFNWVVNALPVLLVIGGAAALYLAVRRWSAQPAETADAEPVLDEDEEPSGIA